MTGRVSIPSLLAGPPTISRRAEDPAAAAVPPIGTIRRILLATDLAAASEGAAVQALDLARDLRAELLIISVIDAGSLVPEGDHAGLRVDQVRNGREGAAQALVSRGRDMGVQVNFLIWEGDAGEAIVEAVRSEQADMVVVGSHGRGPVSRFFLGSVSDHVVRHAPCPVLVVRGRASAEIAEP